MGTDADDTVLIEVLCSIFADIRDIRSKFLHTSLGVTNFGDVLVHVN